MMYKKEAKAIQEYSLTIVVSGETILPESVGTYEITVILTQRLPADYN